ncbi:S8 family peptidase [Polaromonas sp. P1(28)-13]|nr:S8 family peptidase [Polaromonas sp. P1(28)-13]
MHHTYSSALKGFAASLPDAALQGIRNNPNVDYIEQDQTVSLSATETQTGATWGLDRIDQHALGLNGSYQYNYTGAVGVEPSSPAVNAFIIDTGIRATHSDFNGRVNVGAGFTTINDSNDTNDCNGHGTHVAGTVGGTTWGVAKGVTLIPVRVLDCSGSGTWSGVISGIEWVANSTLRPAVANMSLGGGASQAVDTAVANAVAGTSSKPGVTVVVAAGNSSADACKSSPARAPSAITVGATTSSDKRAFYSNYGKCLDLFAPGSGITSASISSNDASTIKSGTSMASPHVAGVAALALAAKPAALPGDVASFLTTNATPNKLGSIGRGSPNLLVYSLGTWTSTSVAVSSMTDSTLSGRNGWNASATVTVRKRNSDWSIGDPAAGATVTGSFSPGSSVSCVTDPSGSCTLTSSIIRSTDSAKVTVTGVSGPLMTYDASQNAVTEIVIAKP